MKLTAIVKTCVFIAFFSLAACSTVPHEQTIETEKMQGSPASAIEKDEDDDMERLD